MEKQVDKHSAIENLFVLILVFGLIQILFAIKNLFKVIVLYNEICKTNELDDLFLYGNGMYKTQTICRCVINCIFWDNIFIKKRIQ